MKNPESGRRQLAMATTMVLSTCQISTRLVVLTLTQGARRVEEVVAGIGVMRTQTSRASDMLLRVTDQGMAGQSCSRWRKDFWFLGEFSDALL